jgi:hypothetical protein
MPVAGQPLQQRLHLDVVDLVAALVAARRVGRHVREALDDTLERQRLACRQHQLEADAAEHGAIRMTRHRRAEAGLAHPLAREPLEVDVGGDEVRAVREALGLGEQLAVLVGQRLAVPGEVGRRFSEPGRRVQVRRDAARRLRRDELVPVPRLADRDVGGRTG